MQVQCRFAGLKDIYFQSHWTAVNSGQKYIQTTLVVFSFCDIL